MGVKGNDPIIAADPIITKKLGKGVGPIDPPINDPDDIIKVGPIKPYDPDGGAYYPESCKPGEIEPI